MTNLPEVIEYTHRKMNRKGDESSHNDSRDSYRIEEEDIFDSIADAKAKPRKMTTLARKITKDAKTKKKNQKKSGILEISGSSKSQASDSEKAKPKGQGKKNFKQGRRKSTAADGEGSVGKDRDGDDQQGLEYCSWATEANLKWLQVWLAGKLGTMFEGFETAKIREILLQMKAEKEKLVKLILKMEDFIRYGRKFFVARSQAVKEKLSTKRGLFVSRSQDPKPPILPNFIKQRSNWADEVQNFQICRKNCKAGSPWFGVGAGVSNSPSLGIEEGSLSNRQASIFGNYEPNMSSSAQMKGQRPTAHAECLESYHGTNRRTMMSSDWTSCLSRNNQEITTLLQENLGQGFGPEPIGEKSGFFGKPQPQSIVQNLKNCNLDLGGSAMNFYLESSAWKTFYPKSSRHTSRDVNTDAEQAKMATPDFGGLHTTRPSLSITLGDKLKMPYADGGMGQSKSNAINQSYHIRQKVKGYGVDGSRATVRDDLKIFDKKVSYSGKLFMKKKGS